MNQRGMTDGERKILKYAQEVLGGPSDPEVSEKISNVYRNLLLRTRAHTTEEMEENLNLVLGIGRQADASPEARKAQSEAVYTAFYTLLGHDQLAALSLVNRIEETHLPLALSDALSALRGRLATLYGLWLNVTARLPDTALEAASAEWLETAAKYCRAMMPANPLAAFAIWQQAAEWHKRFPTESGSVLLIEIGYAIITPNDRSLERLNEALWEFIQEQEEARAAPGQLGHAAQIWSLGAAQDMTRSELAKADADKGRVPDDEAGPGEAVNDTERALGEIWNTALPWITEELPSHPSWYAFEVSLLNEIAAHPLAVFKQLESRLKLVAESWTERHREEAEQSIKFNEQPAAAWVDCPLYRAVWTEVEGEEDARKLLWPFTLPARFLAGKTAAIDRLRFTTPSFYPAQTLFEMQVQRDDGTHAIYSFLAKERQPTAFISGESAPIHAMNEAGLLRFMQEGRVALDYLRFFCASVWGEFGPFRIVERTEDFLFADAPDEELAAKLTRLMEERPAEIKAMSAGAWEASAFVCYQNALFRARFKIEPTGAVEMLEDEPLEAGLPMRKSVMQDGFRFYRGVWPAAPGEGIS